MLLVSNRLSRCGLASWSDALPHLLEKLTATTGPNGSEGWFNCGIEGGGWTPPPFTVDEVVTKDLAAAVAEKNSPFTNCAPYIDDFYAAQGKYGSKSIQAKSTCCNPNNFVVPAIFFASIAMQESSCNPNEVGGAGEQGLMQITKVRDNLRNYDSPLTTPSLHRTSVAELLVVTASNLYVVDRFGDFSRKTNQYPRSHSISTSAPDSLPVSSSRTAATFSPPLVNTTDGSWA